MYWEVFWSAYNNEPSAIPNAMPFCDKYDSLECVLGIIRLCAFTKADGTLDHLFDVINSLQDDADGKNSIVNIFATIRNVYQNSAELKEAVVKHMDLVREIERDGDVYTKSELNEIKVSCKL